MKRITFTILCLLCVASAFALSYASPYKGAGRGGYIYTTSSARQHTISSGLAQAPVASMASTGSSASRGIAYASASAVSMPSVQGIRTSASHVSGGVTTMDTHSMASGPRKAHPGECPGCVDVDPEDGVCDKCGHEIYACECEECHCNVPLDFDWVAGLLMAMLAGAYALYKVRAGKTRYSDVRDANDMRMREAAI